MIHEEVLYQVYFPLPLPSCVVYSRRGGQPTRLRATPTAHRLYSVQRQRVDVAAQRLFRPQLLHHTRRQWVALCFIQRCATVAAIVLQLIVAACCSWTRLQRVFGLCAVMGKSILLVHFAYSSLTASV